MSARLRDSDGTVRDAPEWIIDADDVDDRVLERADAPVLDIGCGPGRHGAALARRGGVVLGIDISRAALAVAHRRGVLTLERSIFGRIPGAGRWRTALLLDGNLGIGGDPVELLARVRRVLAPVACVLAEAAAPGVRRPSTSARLEIDAVPGPWFSLATVAVDDIEAIARGAGFDVADVWNDDRRWFAQLST
ncbi:MAG: methyltransferase domain-containing protein [Actinomycetota bacterium]|nr:methyltransferase domain-containing protein [Actinomycetota bacterium]